MNGHRVTVNLSPAEHARLQELCPAGMSDSAYFRQLLRAAGPVDDLPPTRLEALRLLAESARAGKVAAQVALERALRDQPDRDLWEWIKNG